MLIGELVKKTGLTKETIRHYQEIGLVRGIKIQPNGYKKYTESMVEDFKLISLAKELGFTLKEIKVLVSLLQKGQLGRERMNEVLANKIIEVDHKIQALCELKFRLLMELEKSCSPQEQFNKV